MKNSIEEAIERLEYIDRQYSCNNYYSIWDLECIALLLSDYKRVLKENEELKENKTGLEEEIQEQAKNLIQNEEYITEECILKERVKDKIEELKEKGESDLRVYGFAVETHLALQVLQELIEKEDKL